MARGGRLRGGSVLGLGLRQVVEDQGRLGERGAQPVLGAGRRGLELFLAQRADVARDRAGVVLVAAQERHRGRVDPGVVGVRGVLQAARALVGLVVEVVGGLQVQRPRGGVRARDAEVLVRPRQQAQRLAVGVSLVEQLLQALVGAQHRAAARQRQALQLAQAQVVWPGLEAELDGVVRQERLPGTQQPLGLLAAGDERLVGLEVRPAAAAQGGGAVSEAGDREAGLTDGVQHLPGEAHVLQPLRLRADRPRWPGPLRRRRSASAPGPRRAEPIRLPRGQTKHSDPKPVHPWRRHLTPRSRG